jgi:hypothetical protein
MKRTPEFPKKNSRRRTEGRTENSQKFTFFENIMLAGAHLF